MYIVNVFIHFFTQLFTQRREQYPIDYSPVCSNASLVYDCSLSTCIVPQEQHYEYNKKVEDISNHS